MDSGIWIKLVLLDGQISYGADMKILLIVILTALSQFAAAQDTGAQPEHILFWSQEERRLHFQRMDELMASRPVHRGDKVYELTEMPRDLSDVTYEVEGETFKLSHFMAMESNMGLLVIKDNNILLEHYAPGHTASSHWISFSVTKSVSSMLIGAAIKDGYIKSVDEPVVNYVPRFRGTGYEKTTIKDVLQMASGIRWNEDYADLNSDVAKAGGFNGIQLVRYLATLPAEATPGEKFNYNTGETNLVGEILRAAIGNNAATYLTHKIWKPFGMEYDAFWMLGEPGGGELGGCCINATLRDYARIGIFAMNEGKLPDGTSVLPENWMKESTTPSKGYEGYGYLWWLWGDGSYSALGIFGQTIFIDPENQVVIAVQSNAPTATQNTYSTHRNAALIGIRQALKE